MANVTSPHNAGSRLQNGTLCILVEFRRAVLTWKPASAGLRKSTGSPALRLSCTNSEVASCVRLRLQYIQSSLDRLCCSSCPGVAGSTCGKRGPQTNAEKLMTSGALPTSASTISAVEKPEMRCRGGIWRTEHNRWGGQEGSMNAPVCHSRCFRSPHGIGRRPVTLASIALRLQNATVIQTHRSSCPDPAHCHCACH